MSGLSEGAKEAIIKQVLTRNEGVSIADIAKANNIGRTTLYNWIKHAGVQMNNQGSKSNKSISNELKMNHIIATSSKNDQEVSMYCREHGIYSIQISQWREEFINQTSNAKDQEKIKELERKYKEDQAIKAEMQREINRKNAALAEATALLMLKKNIQNIWGE